MQQTVESEIASGEEGQPSSGPDAEPPESEVTGLVSVERADCEVETETIEWVRERLVDAIGEIPECDSALLTRVTARVVDDREMDEAHRRFSGISGTTDVLTFVEATERGREVDLLVCHQEARRRASELGHDLRRELLLYCLHGVLHALGRDDKEPADHDRMHAEEDRILERIGVGRIFGGEGGR